jgi:hypothetical protein
MSNNLTGASMAPAFDLLCFCLLDEQCIGKDAIKKHAP